MGMFSGKVIVVTGASRGIGVAIARAFAREHGTVIVNYLQNQQAAEQVAAACVELGGDAWAVQADVTSESAVKQLIEQVMMETGKIDVIVNNAFAPYTFDPDERKLAWELAWEDYQAQIDGALRSTYYMCQAVIPIMKKQGGGALLIS